MPEVALGRVSFVVDETNLKGGRSRQKFYQTFSEVFLNLSSFRQRRPRAKFFRNVREVEIRLLSKFQLGTTLGG